MLSSSHECPSVRNVTASEVVTRRALFGPGQATTTVSDGAGSSSAGSCRCETHGGQQVGSGSGGDSRTR